MGRTQELAAVVLAVALLGAACGDSGGTETATTDPPGSTAEGPGPGTLGPDDSVVGAGGGTVTSPDGAVTLEIPAGALSEDTIITVSPAPDFVPENLGDLEIVGTPYEFGPEGLTFAEPATVTFDLGTVENEVQLAIPVATSSDGTSEGLASPRISNDEGRLRISGDTTHFSYMYAVGAGAVVTASTPFFSTLVGTGWITETEITWQSGAATQLSSVDASTAEPSVASVLGTTQVGPAWESEFLCNAAGSTDVTITAEVQLTSAVLQFLAQFLPGFDAVVTVQLDGDATCFEPDTTPTVSGDCPPAVFGDPAADGSVPVTIDNDCLDPLFFAFNESNAADPFWHIHTQQDDIFLSVELYTIYGSSWTGETGTFPLECGEPWGLCAIFDPDGTGPMPVVQWASGDITIARLDAGYDITFSGELPPAADGTVYDLQPVTWTG